MLTKRAVEILKTLNPEAKVLMHDYHGPSVVAVSHSAMNSDILWIESKEDYFLYETTMEGDELKVKYLLEILEEKVPESAIRLNNEDGESLLFIVTLDKNEEVIWLESESDVDMSVELEARIAHALEENEDELDFYIDMLETGITIEMVRKYMGNEYAEHVKEFCEEHGLI